MRAKNEAKGYSQVELTLGRLSDRTGYATINVEARIASEDDENSLTSPAPHIATVTSFNRVIA